MYKIKYITFAFMIMLSAVLCGQNGKDKALIKIDGDNLVITQSDFEYAFSKNQKNKDRSRDSINDFLTSYVTFLLNIEEAKKQGLEKEQNFIDEYSSYIESVEKPYLSDSTTSINIAQKAYNRLNENIEVSHIFIKIPEGHTLPKDTIKPYEKANYIRSIALKKNAPDFETLAKEYSEDSISRYSIRPGYLGWMTALAAPLEFEDAMFKASIDSITEPIRSSAGYHLIKVHNRRADRGQLKVAHLLLRYPAAPTQEQKDSLSSLSTQVYKELIAGASFEDLFQKYTPSTEENRKNGYLGWFGVNKPLPTSLDSILFNLPKNETIAKPIETPYGYYIFKILDRVSLFPFEEMKSDLIESMQKSDRKKLFVEGHIESLSKKYPYEINKETYKKLEQIANNYNVNDSVFFEKIDNLSANSLLTIADKNYKVADFLSYMEEKPTSDYFLSTDILTNKLNDFIIEELIDKERKDLPSENLEFRHISNDYYNSILYYNIMNKEVWEKAQSDKPALKELFEKNKQKYSWSSPKYKGYVIHGKNNKDLKQIQSFIKKNKVSTNLEKALRSNFGDDFMSQIIIEKGLWAKGENSYVDEVLHKTKNKQIIIGYPEFIIEGKLISAPETLDDVYGEVVSDYQSILEQEWVDNLRKKHSVEIDEDVLNSIIL